MTLPERSALLLPLALGTHVIITALTRRDLRQRPVTQVRGNKRVWRVVSALNTAGSLTYRLIGRRH